MDLLDKAFNDVSKYDERFSTVIKTISVEMIGEHEESIIIIEHELISSRLLEIFEIQVIPCKIVAIDLLTGEGILIFDAAKHGYNNMFCTEYTKEQIENRPLKKCLFVYIMDGKTMVSHL